jgi:acyl dehydratase
MTEPVAGSAVGAALPPRTIRLTRTDLVRYAAASGDFNPVHHSDHAARAAGQPGVLAHGMLTMALAAELVTDWAGGPATLQSLRVRFTRPLLVPDDGIGAVLELSGVVAELLADGAIRVDVTARAHSADTEEVAVLGQARAVVRPVAPAAGVQP